MKVIIAIDPGASGGIAVNVFGVADCRAMPATQGDVLALLRCIKASADKSGVETVCVIEAVSGFAGKAQPGSAMFKFGEGYGFLKGVVQALGIKLELVRPQVWQKAFGLGTASRCASKTEWKNKLKAEAQRRFPELDVTLATADALLILEWARGFEPHRRRDAKGNGTEGTDGTNSGAHGVTRPTCGNGFGKVLGEPPNAAREARALPSTKTTKQTEQ